MSGKPRFVKIKEAIKQDIASQKLNINDTIPSARKLADKFSVSYLTARRAIDELIKEGILARKAGHMATVARTAQAAVPAAALRKEKRGRTGSIMILTVSDVLENTNSYFGCMFRAIERAVYSQGWTPVLILIRDIESLTQLIDDNFRPERADGMIVSGIYHEHIARHVFFKKQPALFFDYMPRTVPIDSVGTNNYSIARQVMDHLLGLGHKSIDFFGHQHDPSDMDKGIDQDASEQYAVWQTGIDAGRYQGTSYFGDKEALKALSTPGSSTAVYVSNPGKALRLQEGLAAKGIAIPERLSIATVGGNHIQDFSLTSIDLNWDEMARLAVERLGALIERNAVPGARLLHCGRLTDRGSTAAPGK